MSTQAIASRRLADSASGSWESLEPRLMLSADVGGGEEPVIIAEPLAVTINSVTTDQRRPDLSGTVNDPEAKVYITLNGGMYLAVNNGDGTWNLPGNDMFVFLDPGTYDAQALAVDANYYTASDTTFNEVTVFLSVSVDRIAASSASPRITGHVSQPTAAVWMTINGGAYMATNMGDGTWMIPAWTINPPLDFGTYELGILAQMGGTIARDTTSDELSIVPITVTSDDIKTYSLSPQLTGTVSDAGADVSVTMNGVKYDAVNNGDGTWTLPEGTIAQMSLGTYDIRVQAINSERFIGSDVHYGGLQIVPFVSVDKLTTSSPSPELHGFIIDPSFDIFVTVADKTYQASIVDSEHWQLPAGTISPALPAGTYDVSVQVKDANGFTIIGDSTSDELVVIAPMTTISVHPQITGLSSPVVSGRVGYAWAAVSVIVDGKTYSATVSPDGSWQAAVGPLQAGTYDVQAFATDYGSVVAADSTFDELKISGSQGGTVQTILESGNRRMTFTDSAGNRVVVSLRGPGWAMIDRISDAVTHQGDIVSITVEGSTLSTSLGISVSNGGTTTIQNIVVNGAIGSISGTRVDVLGDVQVDSGIRKLTLGDLSGGNSLVIGVPATETMGAYISLGDVTDGAISSLQFIRSLRVTNWADTDLVADSVTAPAIRVLKVTGSKTAAGDFGGDLVLTGISSQGKTLGSAVVRGSITGATWEITGDVGSITIGGDASGLMLSAHSAIGKIKVGQWITGSTIDSDSSIGSITAGGLYDTDIFAGLAGTELPAAAGDFDAPTASLRKLTVTGSVQDSNAKSTINARLAAPLLGKLTLRDIQPDNGGDPFGIWALANQPSSSRIILREGSQKYLFPDAPESVGDWIVQLV